MSKSPTSILTLLPLPRPSVPKPVLDEDRIGDCVYPHYPWHEWERWAVAQGLDPGLAQLGLLTIREAYQHHWDERLKSLCGWRDHGRRMLRFALRSPEKARQRWQRLLDTDGLRGQYDPQTGRWTHWS